MRDESPTHRRAPRARAHHERQAVPRSDRSRGRDVCMSPPESPSWPSTPQHPSVCRREVTHCLRTCPLTSTYGCRRVLDARSRRWSVSATVAGSKMTASAKHPGPEPSRSRSAYAGRAWRSFLKPLHERDDSFFAHIFPSTLGSCRSCAMGGRTPRPQRCASVPPSPRWARIRMRFSSLIVKPTAPICAPRCDAQSPAQRRSPQAATRIRSATVFRLSPGPARSAR